MSQFAFKQFKVMQNHAAMKVSTDGILLGAWVQLGGAKRLLDIGTGTGLLALMCQQRNPTLSIEAVEIEEAACLDATENFANSPWSKITLHRLPIQAFDSQTPFDLVISNPPYFINSLKGPSDKRNQARHTDGLTFEELLSAFKRLAPEGRFALILPSQEGAHFVDIAKKSGLFISRLCRVKATPNKAVSRWLIELNTKEQEYEESELNIYNEHNEYSDGFRTLCKAFYLKM